METVPGVWGAPLLAFFARGGCWRRSRRRRSYPHLHRPRTVHAHLATLSEHVRPGTASRPLLRFVHQATRRVGLAERGACLAGDQLHQRLFPRGDKTLKVVAHHRRVIAKGKKVRVKKLTSFTLTMLFLDLGEIVRWGTFA